MNSAANTSEDSPKTEVDKGGRGGGAKYMRPAEISREVDSVQPGLVGQQGGSDLGIRSSTAGTVSIWTSNRFQVLGGLLAQAYCICIMTSNRFQVLGRLLTQWGAVSFAMGEVL